jgi:hypothetical protein
MPRLYETRSLRDLAARLAMSTHSLVLMEVRRANLSAAVAWLAAAQPQFGSARFAALLSNEWTVPPSDRRAPWGNDRQIALDAIVEAGACEVALSPRRLDGILALGLRHAKWAAARAKPPQDRPITAWAWAALPWQGEARQVG